MEEDNLRQAEHYFIEGGDWKQCINMYRQRDMWDEAYRVNKPENSLITLLFASTMLAFCQID